MKQVTLRSAILAITWLSVGMAALSLRYRAPLEVSGPIYFFALNGVVVTAAIVATSLLMSVKVTKVGPW